MEGRNGEKAMDQDQSLATEVTERPGGSVTHWGLKAGLSPDSALRTWS